jgi:hypothetical protein
MANTIKPIPTTTAGDPEILPWATSGTTLEPTSGQESTGWQPQAVAGPPDYRLENYARLKQSQLNARGVQGGLFVECAAASIRLSGYAAGVNQRRITINGVNFDVTDGGGTLAAVRDAFVAAINAAPATAALVTASSAGAIGANEYLSIIDNTPGSVYSASPSLAVSVLAGAGTITVTSPATAPIVREDDTGMARDLVIGSVQADDDGDPTHRARIIWRKAKGSFRAGIWTGTGANLTSTGDYSVALGSEVVASGTSSVALGFGANAGGNYSFAAAGSTVAAANGVGLGPSNVGIGGTAGVAIGNNASVTVTNGVALGTNSLASALNGLAANGATASGADSIALGNAAAASGANSIALGAGVTATGTRGAFASGKNDGTLSATAEGARAHGYASIGSTLTASGVGSSASGHTANTSTISATGSGSLAHGYNVNTATASPLTASGSNAQAYGSGSLASGNYSQAMGYGAKATNRGEQAQASTAFNSGFNLQPGSAQKGSFHVALRTTDATADQDLTPEIGVAGTAFTPLADTVYLCEASVIAKKEGTDDSYASWWFKFTVAYVAGVLTVKKISAVQTTGPGFTVALAGAAIAHFDDGGAAGATWVLKCDTNAGNIRFRATGAALTNIRWSARCDYVAVGQQP